MLKHPSHVKAVHSTSALPPFFFLLLLSHHHRKNKISTQSTLSPLPHSSTAAATGKNTPIFLSSHKTTAFLD
uniref:Uncharacterized protein n=1 Tax=Kalanchoe fedtschenkoi TaxID=63787 RepID=A0A7N0T3Q9_KALFE